MDNNRQIANIIRWIARIWGSISLLFLLFMVGAHLVAVFTEPINSGGFGSTSDFLSFIFFPISTIVGLAMALKWEGLGGWVVLIGMIAFHVVRPDLIFDPMIDGLAAPGLFFVGYWLLRRLPE